MNHETLPAQCPVDVTARTQFEAWKRSGPTNGIGLGRSTEPGYTHEYDNPITQQQWVAWNASREAALDAVLRGLRSEDDSQQLRAIISSVEAMRSYATVSRQQRG